jgi:hypothetical protein
VTTNAVARTAEPAWKWISVRAIPVVFFLLCCWPAFQAFFIGDDFVYLRIRQQHEDGVSLRKLLLSPGPSGGWRPVGERLTFYLSQRFAPGNQRPFHAVMVLTQIGSLLLLSAIAMRLTGSRIAATAAPVFWIVNPNLAETLAWCTSYMQILCGFCILLTFYAFLRYVDDGRAGFLALSWAAFLFGFLVMESNLVFPALAGGWALLYSRRHLRTVLPMAVVSIAFAVLHFLFIKSDETAAYAMYFDPASLAQVLWRYTRWFFRPPNIDYLAGLHWAFTSAWAALAFFALMGFTVCTAWRRDFRAALFAFFFLALLAPVMPLREHISGYYLTLPGIGMGLLGGWALARAMRSRLAWRVLAFALLAGWLIEMPWGMFQTSRWWRGYSRESRDFITGLKEAAKLAGGKLMVVSGVSDRVYWNCLYYGCAEAMGVRRLFLSPEWTPAEPAPGGLTLNLNMIADDESLAAGLRAGTVGLYDIQGRKVLDRTQSALAKVQAGRFEPPMSVNAGDPAQQDWLWGDWYPIENGFRWTGKVAGVVLDGPLENGKNLVLTGYCADVPGRPASRELRIRLNEVALPPHALGECKGAFRYRFRAPGEIAMLRRVRVRLELSQTFRTGSDQRQLGLIFGTVGLE